jgi:hypothetical protein
MRARQPIHIKGFAARSGLTLEGVPIPRGPPELKPAMSPGGLNSLREVRGNDAVLGTRRTYETPPGKEGDACGKRVAKRTSALRCDIGPPVAIV